MTNQKGAVSGETCPNHPPASTLVVIFCRVCGAWKRDASTPLLFVNYCSQNECADEACASYVWPGRPHRIFACERHLSAAKRIAEAIGFELGDVRNEKVPL